MPLAGQHKPLPTQARSQGEGATPHQHPRALLGQGGSQGTAPTAATPLKTQVCSVLPALAPRVLWAGARHQSCASCQPWRCHPRAQQFARKLYLGKYFWKGIKSSA